MRKVSGKKRVLRPEYIGFSPEVSGRFTCTILEDRSVMIENGGEVVMLTDKVVRLKNGEKFVSVYGEGLTIRELGRDHLGISGKFTGISYREFGGTHEGDV